ncbi:vancomycin high temperature exclusion protein [Succinimonas sp.]|uniref:SanA/YdcF family protein n=1 Tax=Succinimonas sp. TaxID=1936151 RepID=UPI0038648F9B
MSVFKNEFSGFLHIVLYCFAVIALFLCVLLLTMVVQISCMSAYTYDLHEIDAIPYNRTGLVLGTSKYLVHGGINGFWTARINAASDLYHAGKISYIVVSGDNSHRNYNEPRQMRKALIAKGVPRDRIYLDYAGFRTLDSVVRIQRIFRQKNITVISQDFQNERAIYIARQHGINAVGFNAESSTDNIFTTDIREFFARIRCVLDLHVWNSKPRFLGDAIHIGDKNIDPKEAQMLEDSQPPLPADDIADPEAGEEKNEPGTAEEKTAGEQNGRTEDGRDESEDSKDSNNGSISKSARSVPAGDDGFAFMDLFSAR